MGRAIPPTDDERIQQPRCLSNISSPNSTNTRTVNQRSMARPERLEDVFQDDIMLRFSNSDFKKFARSSRGLGLPEHVIENVSEDYRGQSEEMRWKLLSLWRQRNGRNATCERIREIADGFQDHLNSLGQ